MLSGFVRKRNVPSENQIDLIPNNVNSDEKKSKILVIPCTLSTKNFQRNECENTVIDEHVTVFAGAVVPSNVTLTTGALQCIGILPGIGKYTESSDSDKSTDTEDDCENTAYDWLGRKAAFKSQCQEQ